MTTKMIELLSHLLADEHNPLVFLAHYGSRKASADIDLLAVYRDQGVDNDRNVGRLDLLCLSLQQFRSLLALCDPIASEPLITGNLVFGDIDHWEQIKSQYLGALPDRRCLFHLIARSVDTARIAESHLESSIATGIAFSAHLFWKNLGFAVAYLEFAKRYAAGEFPLTFAQLRNGPSHAAELLRKCIVQPEDQPSEDSMRSTLSDFKNLLVERITEKRSGVPCAPRSKPRLGR